jgi:hypothetical protein
MAFGRDPNIRKLPRSVRKIARSLLRHRGHHRASELRAAGGAMEHHVRSQTERMPALTDPGDRLVQRVRIGAETRGMLKRLLAARSIHVQRALVREIRKSIADRIALHMRRSEALAAARRRARTAAAWVRARGSEGRARVSAAWRGRGGPVPQTRSRAPRTAPAAPGAPSPAVRAQRSRAGRWARARARRTAA